MLQTLVLVLLIAGVRPFALPVATRIVSDVGKARSSSLYRQASVEANVDTSRTKNPSPQSHYDAIICGGGPAGLLSAIMLSQKFGPSFRIALCEQRPQTPPSPSDEQVWSDIARFYLLGIGHRGQKALKRFGVYDDFVNASVPVLGRRDWATGQGHTEGRITAANKDVVSRILARDKLVGVLYHHLVKNYIDELDAQIDLLYGYQVQPISLGENDKGDLVKVQIFKCEEGNQSSDENNTVASQDSDPQCDIDLSQEATTNFLVGADGAARTVANAMEALDAQQRAKQNPLQRLLSPQPFRVKRFVDDNPRVFKSVPIRTPQDWPKNLNYSARSTDSRITMEALPSDDKGTLCALLLIKPGDEFAQPNVDPTKLRAFFDEEFPQFSALIDKDEMKRLASKPATALPAFRYAGPRLHAGRRTLVLGDAAHTVKPYYGLGCNTALEDVEILGDILEEMPSPGKASKKEDKNFDPTLDAAMMFSKRRALDSKALVTISRNMDRPGKMFFVTFLIPIILDGIFHKMAPRIFGPNVFGMFQRQDIGFRQIQQKKRLDRALQVAILGAACAGFSFGLKWAITSLAKALGKSSRTVSFGLALGLFATALFQKYLQSSKTTVEPQ